MWKALEYLLNESGNKKDALTHLQYFIWHCNMANMLQLYWRNSALESRRVGWRREWNIQRSQDTEMRVLTSHCLKYSEENTSHGENRRYQPLIRSCFCVLVSLRYQILKHGGFWLNCCFLPFLLFFFFFFYCFALLFHPLILFSCPASQHTIQPHLGCKNVFNLNF